MATVYYGRLDGPSGFSRVVAIKRLHPQNAKNPEFVAAFLDEAQMAARVRHPNVVSVQDVVSVKDELLIVMDYVPGETLSRLVPAARARGDRIAAPIAAAVLLDILRGLEAAHDARGPDGALMNLVHRDISPQNVLVGQDGVSRIMDFGVAKALGRSQTTTDDGQIKGKAAYMSPEQVAGSADARTDLWAASVVVWELLAGRRLFTKENDIATLQAVLSEEAPDIRSLRDDVPPALAAAIQKGLERSPLDRWATAHDYAAAVSAAATAASPVEMRSWVRGLAANVLAEREHMVRQIESTTTTSMRQAEQRRGAAATTWRSAIWLGALLGVVALGFLVFAATRRADGTSATPASAPIGSSAALVATEAPAPPSIAPSGTPPPQDPPAASASASVRPAVAPADTRGSKKATRAGVAPSRAAATSAASAALCPYVDADGIVKFRPCT
jgi:serine/threonine-protein kinase